MLRAFTFQFYGQIGSNYFESFSIKDFKKEGCILPTPPPKESPCSQKDWICNNQVCVDPSVRCNFVDDCGDNSDEINCVYKKMLNFENGFDSWTAKPREDEHTNGYSIKKTKKFHSFRGGPLYDHTYGPDSIDGSMLMLKQSFFQVDGGQDIEAELESPYFTYNTQCSLSFFFFKNSPNSTITVLLQDMSQPDERIILQQHREYSHSWLQSSTNFYGYGKNNALINPELGNVYKVIISSSVYPTDVVSISGPPFPYVAIDDISFGETCRIMNDNFVPTLPTKAGGITETFAPDNCATVRCKNSKGVDICLKPDQLCDFVKDCVDGSDEANCGNCDFDKGNLCEWSTTASARSWKAQKPASSSPDSSPKMDGNKNPDGGYAAVDSPGFFDPDKNSKFCLSLFFCLF